MNRRGFLNAMLKAGAGFSILPSAVFERRKWIRRDDRALWEIDWEDVEIGTAVDTKFECVMIPPPYTILKSVTHNFVVDIPEIIENFSKP